MTETRGQTLRSRSQAQVVWAQFRKHRLAVWGGRILLVMYTVALFAGFFSVYDPNYYETSPPKGNHPPSIVHFRDPDTGKLSRPFVYATKREFDVITLQPKYLEDPAQGKFYIHFFVRTPEQPYTLFKLFKSDFRLFGVKAPGRLFLAGTDNFGRDLWSRLMYGGQVSLSIGIFASFIAFVLGLVLGGIAGYFSGKPIKISAPFLGKGSLLWRIPFTLFWLALAGLMASAMVQFWRVTPGFSVADVAVGLVGLVGASFALLAALVRLVQLDLDDLIMRLVEIISAIPGLFLLISLRAVFPTNMDALLVFYLVVFILGFIGWGGLARVVRGLVLSLREFDFTQAARALGASDARIIGRHILPSTASYIIVSLSLSIPGAILGESSLSFLGLGVREPYTSWGLLLSDAQAGGFASFADRPWVLWPGFFIFLAVLSWNFLGDGLRDAFDPRKRR